MTRRTVLMACLLARLAPEAGAAEQAQTAEKGKNAAAEQIRRLIPRAAGVPMAVFEKIARSPTTPKLSDFDDQALTIALLFEPPVQTKAARKEFRSLRDPAAMAKPAELAQEIAGPRWITGSKIARKLLRPYATMIHADRITGVTCKVEGEQATGTVAFRVPKLYEGKIPYVARRKDGDWRIVEFRLPCHGFRVVRDAEGKWKREELKPTGANPEPDEPARDGTRRG